MNRVYQACLVLCSLAGEGVAQTSAPRPTPTPIPVEGKLPHSYFAGTAPGTYFHWTVEPWTTSDNPYLAISKAIDAQIKAGQNRRQLAARCKRTALATPLNAAAQFRWAYAAFMAYENRWQTGKDETDVLAGVREGMEKAQKTNSYQYARLRLLITHLDKTWFSDPSLLPCALRLLKRNPNDTQIKVSFAGNMTFTSSPVQEQDLGYRWAKEYLAQFPNRPQALYIMGFVLTRRISRTFSRKTAAEAMVYLRRCQQMLPANHLYRKRAQEQIDRANEAVAIFQRVGKLKP